MYPWIRFTDAFHALVPSDSYLIRDFPAKPNKTRFCSILLPPPQVPTTPVPAARVNKAALKREKAKARAAAPAITVDYEEWFSRCVPSSETEEHELSCHVHHANDRNIHICGKSMAGT